MIAFKKPLTIAEVEFTVETPVHGGGVRPGQVDPVTGVRAAEVKAALRFWWRATHGCLMKSLDGMRQSEQRLFGSAVTQGNSSSGPGLVQLQVLVPKNAAPKAINPNDKGKGVKYGAFAAIQNNESLWHLPGTYVLRLTAPSHKPTQTDITQLKDAVAAFFALGGIGGRTRRGFGAVFAKKGAPNFDLDQFLARQGARLDNVPGLAGGMVDYSSQTYETGEEALEDGLERLWAFRQGDEGRTPKYTRAGGGAPRPGQSFWPEADFVRRKSPGAWAHRPVFTIDELPRATFGMPLIIDIRGNNEPDKATIAPDAKKDQDRLASPLILRPVKVPLNGREQYRCCALRLSNDMPKLRASSDAFNNSGLTHALTQTNADQIKPLGGTGAPGSGNPDVLAAFLQFFAK